MKRKLPALLMILFGAAFLLGALALYSSNVREDRHAGEASEENLSKLIQQMELRAQTPSQPEETSSGREVIPTEPEAVLPEETEPTRPLTPEECVMPEIQIDGNAYIGYLSVPELELALPVISQWNYDLLQIAPCRYTGTMKGKDLILLAHNYDKHFGRLDELQTGSQICFTDVDGTTYRYAVVAMETLDGADVEGMTTGGYDLTLFTCTFDSQSRVVIRCERTKS